MKTLLSTTYADIPEGVTVEVNSRQITVTGPRGTLKRNVRHLQLQIQVVDDGTRIRIDIWHALRKQLACMNSLKSMMENLVTGVTTGFQFKMRFVYAHFPINVTCQDDKRGVEIRNFLGEKRVRKVAMLDGVTCYRAEKTKDELVIEGNDLDLVSQSAASVHQSCLVKNKDIRKFLDGIYVSERGHVVEASD